VPKKSNVSLQKKGPSRSNSASRRSNQVRDISRWDAEEDESDLEPLDVQLFMKQSSKKITRTFTSNGTSGEQVKPTLHPLPNLRNDSVSSAVGAGTTGTKRMLKESATLSRKASKHGHNTISSFFKPL
jgi:hypothetical protein